jgi:HAD superfamily hydrolase (TIGR01509 family)
MGAKVNTAIHAASVVLWDNDGVLVDTESLFFEVTRAAFARLGLALTKEIWSTRYLTDGKPSREIALALGADPDLIDQVLSDRNKEYRQILSRPPTIRPQVRETLQALFGRIRMAIVTGCDRDQLDRVHASSGLLKYFELVVTSDDCPNAKPDAGLYLTALRSLKIAPEECIALEDSPRGLAAAHAAGIACLAVPTELTQSLPFPGAFSVEKDVSAVLKWLKGPLPK